MEAFVGVHAIVAVVVLLYVTGIGAVFVEKDVNGVGLVDAKDVDGAVVMNVMVIGEGRVGGWVAW